MVVVVSRLMGAHANDRVSMRWWIGEDCVMVAGDDDAEEKESWGESLFRIVIPLPNVPQSTVLGHCLAAGFASGSQLVESQVTAPGVPDLPAATPHLVAHPLGSACVQLPNSVACVKIIF